MKVADYLFENIIKLGINNVFYSAKNYKLNLFNTLLNYSELDCISCTTNLNAGYAANGYARIKGYGVVLTNSNDGELELINSIAGSYAENVPIICIVEIPSLNNINNNCFINTFQKITAKSVILSDKNTKKDIDEILKYLIKYKQPVYIAIPENIINSDFIEDCDNNFNWESNLNNLNELTNLIVKKINSSKSPLVFGDALIKRFDAQNEYNDFLKKLNCPVTNFQHGIDLINLEYENYLGEYFHILDNPNFKNYYSNCDCFIFIGNVCSNDFQAFDVNNHIAIYGTYAYFEGTLYKDVKMSELLRKITHKIVSKSIKIEKSFKGFNKYLVDSNIFSIKFAFSSFQNFLNEDDILLVENNFVEKFLMRLKFPRNINIQFFTRSNIIGGGTAALLGACLAKPNSRIILITDEISHKISILEICKIIELDLKPIIIVLRSENIMKNMIFENFKFSKLIRSFDGNIWSACINNNNELEKNLRITKIMKKICYLELFFKKAYKFYNLSTYMQQKKHDFSKTIINSTYNNDLDVIDHVIDKIKETDSIRTTCSNKESNFINQHSIKYKTIIHKKLEE